MTGLISLRRRIGPVYTQPLTRSLARPLSDPHHEEQQLLILTCEGTNSTGKPLKIVFALAQIQSVMTSRRATKDRKGKNSGSSCSGPPAPPKAPGPPEAPTGSDSDRKGYLLCVHSGNVCDILPNRHHVKIINNHCYMILSAALTL